MVGGATIAYKLLRLHPEYATDIFDKIVTNIFEE